ncbi:recombinase family protein [Bacillus sp. SJS]|uniref:recombinase family protein n=1 Tax=Bacillus sp. SJS TaxID=1423321 RepID=UPI0004DD042D|nr:recombinase family protein [Bacillus sp. SJS]KZZ82524.1 resolvase [Bacillus sp. SJS]
MRYGYSRVSSVGQNLEAQILKLKEFGCDKVFKEKISGRKRDNRTEFQKMLDTVKEGDTVIVTKLDRMARSTKDALEVIELLNERQVALVVLNMGGSQLDTSTPIGKLMVTVLSGIAEFEADMIRERQLEGIELAKQRGVYKGRPKKYTEKHKGLAHAIELFRKRNANGMTVNEICEITNVSRATLYREVRE